MRSRSSLLILVLTLTAVLAACGSPWNNPYPDDGATGQVLYGAFNERPKHLDPVQSYSSNEITFTAQIYTPPLQYHYLARPFRLEPFAATTLPVVRHLGPDGQPVDSKSSQEVAYSVYEIHIRPDLRYQPHPAFAQDAAGRPRYQALRSDELAGIRTLSDFGETSSREVTADDFVYQIKRLAHPRLHSPILGLMTEYIVGLSEFAIALKEENDRLRHAGRDREWLDLRRFPLAGVEVVDRHTFRVTLKGRYPQFVYWLAMPFFAPMPFEADRFYAQPGLAEKNISLDWYPVGSGPYMLTRNDPNREMVLERNPNYFEERYPEEGEPADHDSGFLNDAGTRLPMIDRAVFSLEKESIPYWNKFLQGYYDFSGITSDAFDQAVQVSSSGGPVLTAEMREKGMSLSTAVAPSTFYLGFNMLDSVVGGGSEQARQLRQAISIAVDYEEFIAIFLNGRA
ncbi:MAG: ABC transporter substrate-binding protein [Vicinamibacterales bacterium]